jgi:hypothetical protein
LTAQKLILTLFGLIFIRVYIYIYTCICAQLVSEKNGHYLFLKSKDWKANKMTYKNCQTVGTVPKSIIKITERGTIDDPQHTNT